MKASVFIVFALMSIIGVSYGQGRCPDACPFNYDPKCGFNGNCYKQFSNACDFKVTNCRSSGAFREVGLELCENPSNKKC